MRTYKSLTAHELITLYYTLLEPKEDYLFYATHRPEQFVKDTRKGYTSAQTVVHIKVSFYKEITSLLNSGLQKSDPHYIMLKKALTFKHTIPVGHRSYFAHKPGKEVIKGAYLIAEALGMQECMEKLKFIKNYKRKKDT